MTKKSILARQKKREYLVNKYSEKRKQLSNLILKTKSVPEKFHIYKKLQKLPRNSSKVRLRNRCWTTGRPRGYFRFFGLCRNIIRCFGHQGFLPGIIKASW